MIIERRHGLRVLRLDDDGRVLAGSAELAARAIEARAEIVVVPTSRLHDDFFDLGTGVADAFVRGFATHRIRLAVVGRPGSGRQISGALTAWIAESDRGAQLAFVDSLTALDHRLEAERRHRSGELSPYPGRKV